MQRALLFKAILVAVVFAILVIPLKMIGGIVSERAARQQAVAQEIASSSFGRQTFAGPLLSLPYTEEYEEESGEGKQRKIEKRSVEHVLRVFPATARIDGKAAVGEKHRGLFKVRTFTLDVDVLGTFVLDGKARVERTRAGSRIVWGRPVISFALSDPRGLAGTPTLEWAGERLPLERGTGVTGLSSGLHAQPAPIDPIQPQSFPYRLAMRISGTQSMAIVPLADDNRVRLASDWPHPRFAGQFLPQPESQETGNAGFVAQWAVSALSSNAQQRALDLVDGRTTSSTTIEGLEVGFIDPVDIYSLSDRALKYGFMFIGLTFGCFIVFEIVKRLPIHPAQYGLVGLALATFFLLLIGLSEHIAFWMAYATAATACVALLGFYLATVLRSAGRGVAFAAVLTALYGALYGLLVSEDSALLLGSVLVFAMLAAAMVLTRKVDWYQVGAGEPAAPKSSAA